MGDVPAPVPPRGQCRNTVGREREGRGVVQAQPQRAAESAGQVRGWVLTQGRRYLVGAGAMVWLGVLRLGSCRGEVSASTARGTVTGSGGGWLVSMSVGLVGRDGREWAQEHWVPRAS